MGILPKSSDQGGRLPTLTKWHCFQYSNALAYFSRVVNYGQKCFIVFVPDHEDAIAGDATGQPVDDVKNVFIRHRR